MHNLRYGDDTILMAEREEKLKGLLKVKEESEKAGLNLNIQNPKMMASSLTIWWQIEQEKVESVKNFVFLGSKITVDGDFSHEKKDACSLEGKLWQI